jgi:malate dehydrogenase (quinone)
MLSLEEKVEVLREFIPNAKDEDWEIAIAGQRVQVIRKDEEEGGVLEFGTEVVTAHDGTIAALLGASPGASTSVTVMLEVMEECFPELMQLNEWKEKLEEMIPSFGKHLADDKELANKIKNTSNSVLGI